MTESKKVAVLGAGGFVGSAVCDALRQHGHVVIPLRAPRIDPQSFAPFDPDSISSLVDQLDGCTAVVNAAGLSEAISAESASLQGANSVMPGLVARITSDASVRFIHVSSAAVQGRIESLDASTKTAPFSAYSASKARGETEVLQYGHTVVYRPPGVHGADRQVTQKIGKLARSKFSCVAGDGRNNTAQALIENVGDAIAYLATCQAAPPRIVNHPSEGQTVAGLLNDLGGHPPVHLPAMLARLVVASAFLAGRFSSSVAGQARRLEMLWFGQKQSQSWLTEIGWIAPVQLDGWQEVGRRLEQNATRKDAE